ncbi:hypothetical protein H4R18_001196 [Coemansia javaensis]|uniref:5-formyltetrahydrofolate cyclo-ligase n=1 Tax=Coemansia javaensis TaxID=2761396 RepID=A0A9W8HG91_9FUNG|nr:hypothetical protein H4R18_001196 [Coemansia javaensis]
MALAKRQLRAQMRQALAAVPPAQVQDESARVCAHVMRLAAYQRAQRISIYLSMDSGELQTDALVADARRRGKAVFVPRVAGARMDMVPLPGDVDPLRLPRDRWGIRVPPPGLAPADPESLDFVVVPGVAFDRAGNRCGHGRGYYDRYLARAAAAYACAVCLAAQVVPAVPTDPHDRSPDAVIAPAGPVFVRNPD